MINPLRTTALLSFFVTCALSPLAAQTPRGPELKISESTSVESVPQVATAANGDFVVVWAIAKPGEASHVWARLFKANGTPKGREFRLTKAQGQELYPAVAMGAHGDFVVVWTGGRARDSSVYGRRFTANGKPLGDRFRLSKNTIGSQFDPDVALAPDGSFVVAWASGPDPYGVDAEIYARRFASDGTPAGPDIYISGAFYGTQHSPRVGMSASGGFVVAWSAYIGEHAFYDVLAQIHDASGTLSSGELRLNNEEYAIASQPEFELAVAPGGEFVVVWTDFAADVDEVPPGSAFSDDVGILGQRFTANGTPVGDFFEVNSMVLGAQVNPSVALVPGGGFFVVWESEVPEPQTGATLYGRRFSKDAVPIGREIRISVPEPSYQLGSAISIAPNGRGVVAWLRQDPKRSGVSEIFARLIQRR